MQYKRLYYYPSVHGGGVGLHDLRQGSAIPGLVFAYPGIVRPLTLLSPIVSGDNFDLGTLAEPDIINAGFFPEYDVLDGVHNFGSSNTLVATASNWAIRVNAGAFTAGVYEFLVPLWVS